MLRKLAINVVQLLFEWHVINHFKGLLDKTSHMYSCTFLGQYLMNKYMKKDYCTFSFVIGARKHETFTTCAFFKYQQTLQRDPYVIPSDTLHNL